MSYTKRVWENTGEEVTYEDFNRIEQGIESNDLEISKQKDATKDGTLAKQIADMNDQTKEGSLAKKIADAEEQINVLSEHVNVYILSKTDGGEADGVAKYKLGITPTSNTNYFIRTGSSPSSAATSIQITDSSNNVWTMKIQNTNVVDTMQNANFYSFNAGGIYRVFFASRKEVNGCVIPVPSYQYLAQVVSALEASML